LRPEAGDRKTRPGQLILAKTISKISKLSLTRRANQCYSAIIA
jgi:hypothetical protein